MKKIDLQQFSDYYNLKLQEVIDSGKGTNATKVRLSKNDPRIKKINVRNRESDFVNNWKKIIDLSFASDFLMGRTSSGTRSPFKLTMEWLIHNQTNYLKILQGNFSSKTTVNYINSSRKKLREIEICTHCWQMWDECTCKVPEDKVIEFARKYRRFEKVEETATDEQAIGLIKERLTRKY